jgi:sugar/nucleoside kinase (ribokinase family)
MSELIFKVQPIWIFGKYLAGCQDNFGFWILDFGFWMVGMNGLFVGLTTLDLIYLSETFPKSNEKIVAIDQVIAAGGPATNAAVTFRYFGNRSLLLSVIGNHPIAQLIAADLATYAVETIDLEPQRSTPPPVSSIIITRSTGDRAVISLNAVKLPIAPDGIPSNILTDIDIVLIDGHQLAIAQIIAQQARQKKIPVVLDGGSWKPGLEQVLPWVDYAICSANFHPPNYSNSQAVFAYFQGLGIPHVAITHGERPIEYYSEGKFKRLEVSLIHAIDTLGAGDIFHGAFCHYILLNSFPDSLMSAAKIASHSCEYFGTRQWLRH